jgi:YD repeat-containing protein
MVAATDGNGATTRFDYDAAGQLIGRVNAAGQETSCAYDDLGRLIRRQAGGVVSTFGFGLRRPEGRGKSEPWPRSAGPNIGMTVSIFSGQAGTKSRV